MQGVTEAIHVDPTATLKFHKARPLPYSNVEAIMQAAAPRNVSELHSFLGLENYYAKFLPNLSTRLSLLYTLLKKQRKWSRGQDQTKVFNDVKSLLESS